MERTGRSDASLGNRDDVDVVVVGGGLAGLAAGATAARAGASTVVLDAHAGGGRAAVRRVPLDGCDGEALFNGGPRALYVGGAGRPVLDRLGVVVQGTRAPSKGSAALLDGRLEVLPSGGTSLLRTAVVPRSSKAALLRALIALVTGRARPGRPDEAMSAWIADLARGRDDVAGVVAALARVATYTAGLDELSADAGAAQICHAVGKGVLYLDGGFQQLLDGLADVGRRYSMAVCDRSPVAAVQEGTDGRWIVTCGDGSEVRAAAVVVAAGGPAVAASLLDRPDLVAGAGSPVTAACLEMAVAGAVPTRFVVGIDEPLYLSEHCPPADLAPKGVRLVHVARYGSTDAAVDRSRLEDMAGLAGIAHGDVVARRFLARMVVQTATPSVDHGGLPGRPPVTVEDRPGAFLAGDWVGPVGLLADASLSSGETAGALAAAHARRSPAAGAARTTAAVGGATS